MLGLGPLEFIITLFPLIIMLGVTIFVIILFVRLVRAVEKIANKLEKE